MNYFVRYLTIFLTFCFVGWLIELFYRSTKLKRIVNPGFMVGPSLPVYGTGALVIFLICQIDFHIDYKLIDILIKFLIISFVLTLVEFVAGWISLKLYHNRLWDYSNRWGNIMGIVCPQFTLVWGILGLVFYLFIYPNLVNYTDYVYNHNVTILLLGLFYGIFLVDLGYSIHLLDKIRAYAKRIKETVNFEALKESIIKSSGTRNERLANFRLFKVTHQISAALDSKIKSLEDKIKKR